MYLLNSPFVAKKLTGVGKGNVTRKRPKLQISWRLIKFMQFFMCLVVSSSKLLFIMSSFLNGF